MKLEKARAAYDYYTGKAGDVGRQLAFGGIAVVWLLHGPTTDLAFPRMLLYALLWFFGSLCADFLQYLTSSLIWGGFHWVKEKCLQHKGIDPDSKQGEFKAPEITNLLGLLFFWGKSFALVKGGLYLIWHIWGRIAAV